MRSSRLTVEREGVLTLPHEVCEAAGLQPGDILAMKAHEEHLDLEVYRELLDGALEYMGESILWGFVAEFMSLPLTSLEPGGQVFIPGEVFPLSKGSELSLYVEQPSGRRHFLHLFRVP